MFHAWKKSPLSAWGKMFSIWALGMARNCEWTRNDALLWTAELQEIDHTSFSRMKIKARNNRKRNDVFNSTPLAILSATRRRWNDFCSTFSWRKCEIENIFPHLSTRRSKGDFFTHRTSNSWWKLEINWSFQLVSHLRFIVLWLTYPQLVSTRLKTQAVSSGFR
jgi:hypothetical protein